MFNRDKKTLLILAVLALLLNPNISFAADANVASVDAGVLPINAAQAENKALSAETSSANTLVSPSKPHVTENLEATPSESTVVATEKTLTEAVQNAATIQDNKETSSDISPSLDMATDSDDDFNFDLKMKALGAPTAPVAVTVSTTSPQERTDKPTLTDEDLPKAIQYKTNPIDNLGNNILSQMDDDLFSQMSEIEKSTTLLTLELRREKIRNEIEAQKAIRRKAFDDLEKQKADAKLKELEKQKQIEAQVLKEQQVILDKQQLLEVLKQRKLLNAYMNYMLVNQQEWLKEKEELYHRLAEMEKEKKALTEVFKKKIETLVEASAKNMQVAEAAKANFDRVVRSLKARNEQLRKRIEADAKIIKNTQGSLYLKSQSLDELQSQNLELAEKMAEASATTVAAAPLGDEKASPETAVVAPTKLSAQFAILGIVGRGDTMAIDVIDANGQPISLKVGSALPSGHVLREIGSDYAMFTRNGIDEYLYVGRTIDGVIPTLGLVTTKGK